MTIRRVVPDIKSQNLAESRAFYVDFLGLELAMDMGFVMTFVSPSNPTAQISVVRDESSYNAAAGCERRGRRRGSSAQTCRRRRAQDRLSAH